MESPPSSSTWSEQFILSDDSGLLLTNSSISSGSMSEKHHHRIEDSDCEDKSFSSLDGMSDIICGEHFNTLKKGPQWDCKCASPIAPPPQFRDQPAAPRLEAFAARVAARALRGALAECGARTRPRLLRPYADFVPFSPGHARPASRSSLGSARLSSSHGALAGPAARRADDSGFITQAVSHDTLTTNQISDLYNVPFECDVYAVPVDVVRPKARRGAGKRRRRSTATVREGDGKQGRMVASKKCTIRSERYHWFLPKETKRHSVAGTSLPSEGEPIHMTLQEVRHYLQTLYSSSSDSSEQRDDTNRRKQALIARQTPSENKYSTPASGGGTTPAVNKDTNQTILVNRTKKSTFLINIKNKKVKDSCDNNVGKQINTTLSSAIKADKRNNSTISSNISNNNNNNNSKKSSARLFSFKQALCNMFKFKRFLSPEHVKCSIVDDVEKSAYINGDSNISSRALPPLPLKEVPIEEEAEENEHTLDFATSIQRVKDYGWYWGPLPSEMAEKILSNEPDGSFIVRDSSDDHYIFSLTFKLNNCVRHVRIDHDQGNFSFGSCTKFKSQTIVEFIENAVEHSRSGRYLFFLHRRPVIGPVRVQLLHPVSRFKQVQSLQHICRFVIHKVVRRDLIPSLPLPRRMIDYLNTPHYYSEHLVDVDDETVSGRNPTPAIRRDYDSNEDVDEEIVEHLQAQIEADNRIVPINNYILVEHNATGRQS